MLTNRLPGRVSVGLSTTALFLPALGNCAASGPGELLRAIPGSLQFDAGQYDR
jgi:hypothetical protein